MTFRYAHKRIADLAALGDSVATAKVLDWTLPSGSSDSVFLPGTSTTDALSPEGEGSGSGTDTSFLHRSDR